MAATTMLALSAGCLLLALPLYLLRERRAAFVLLAVLLMVGVSLMLRWRHERVQVQSLARLDGESVQVEGVITEITPRAGSVDYYAVVRFPGGDHLPDRATLQLRSFGGAVLLPGDPFTARVKIGAFSTTRSTYNLSRGAFVRGTLDIDTLRRTATSPFEFTRLAVNLREGMAAKLRVWLPEETAALLQGMLLGRGDSLDDADALALSRSGIGHLLAVSGLHLSILTGLLVRLLERLRCPRALRHLLAILAGFAFCGLVGFSASVLRAFVMLAVYNLVAALPIRDRTDTLSSLGLSLLIICVLFPHWTLSSGIWLSASSTAGIALFSTRFEAVLGRVLPEEGTLSRRLAAPFFGALAMTLAAYAVSAPFLVLTAGWVSLVSPAVNLLLAPLLPIILGGGMLLAVLPLWPWLGPVAAAVHACCRVLLRIAGAASALPFAVLGVDRLYRLVWLAGALVVIWLLLRWRAGRALWRLAALSVTLCLALGSLTYQVAAGDHLEVVALENCRQVVLLRGSEAVVVGTPNQYEIGTLLRYLDYRGVRRVRAIIATDSNAGPDSGVLRLARRYPIDQVFGPDDDFVLGQLAAFLPDCEILRAPDDSLLYLMGGGAAITPRMDGLLLLVEVGEHRIVRWPAELDPEALRLLAALAGADLSLVDATGTLYWAADAPPQPEPLGALLFGETRLSLNPYAK